MPTLYAYANDPGYYIRAWTQDTQNINYKIESEAWPIIEQDDSFQPGEDITWSQVDALKALGVIYTDESGVITTDDDEFQPDPDRIDAELSEQQAHRLLESIQSVRDLTDDELSTLLSILGLDREDVGGAELDSPLQEIATTIEVAVESSIPVEDTLKSHFDIMRRLAVEGPNSNDPISVEVIETTSPQSPLPLQSEDEQFEFTILLLDSKYEEKEDTPLVRHGVTLDGNGVASWEASTTEPGLKVHSELLSQAGALLEIIAEDADELWADDPESMSAPEVTLAP